MYAHWKLQYLEQEVPLYYVIYLLLDIRIEMSGPSTRSNVLCIAIIILLY
jgi:hypothetical protein